MNLVLGEGGPPRVIVLNGNGVSGSAGRWGDWLDARGIEVDDVDDADRQDYSATTVIAQPSSLAAAEDLIELIGVGSVTMGTLDEEIDLILVLGADATDPPG